MNKISHLTWHDIKTHYFYSGMIFVAPIFSVITLLFLHFTIDPSNADLLFMPLVWISLCFGAVLSVPVIFNPDVEDGYLSTLLVTEVSEPIIVLAKFIAHWSSTTLPLVILLCVMVGFLDIANINWVDLIAILLIVSLIISILCTLVAAIVINCNRAMQNIAILVLLPFLFPVCIFGNLALTQKMQSSLCIIALIGIFLITISITLLLSKTIIRDN